MNIIDKFKDERILRIENYSSDIELIDAKNTFKIESIRAQYSYNFDWLSRPIIQYPQDMVAMQELIWAIKPDLIIETGIAHGGSLILSASMLALIDYCEAAESGKVLDPAASKRRVLGIDIDIREHNLEAIKKHPLSHKIDMLQGSSIAPEIVSQVYEIAEKHEKIIVFLDSLHTHDHVLEELEAYAPLTSFDSYCVVFDTIIEDLPPESFPDRPWDIGNNPKTAVWEYLKRLKNEGRKAYDSSPLNFEIDKVIENKLLITVAPDGFLKRI
ncbi:cephalosporin hydroxylase family protein [Myxococcota bacterium]|nr:cephalosporin hydroxylase family protein [Myxococcota bacterium]MBU1381413.1 cephalosporin hydroxylase family protein [Myxococcota bacterium]MBU1498890.1 cephalosporin hydroxylase family protein [Myxococcota bacterium]